MKLSSDNGDECIAAVYGRLYTWYAVTDSRNICPAGWHVPSFAEFEILINYLGGFDKTSTADKLREVGTTHWKSTFPETNNSSGFTALPSRTRTEKGVFNLLGTAGGIISTDEYPYDNSKGMGGLFLGSNLNYLTRGGLEKKGGHAVRCVKDK
ncbi:MAG: fibrobacter succinogenes major paralogous domain-containing protein [Rikenellaceae bacterium]|nr:fibrobacter succinogenes major paralogous domain-containing protein [Rikenellaceae bacterium]